MPSYHLPSAIEWGKFHVRLAYKPDDSALKVVLEDVTPNPGIVTEEKRVLIRFAIIPNERVKFKTHSKDLSNSARFNQKFVIMDVDSSMDVHTLSSFSLISFYLKAGSLFSRL